MHTPTHTHTHSYTQTRMSILLAWFLQGWEKLCFCLESGRKLWGYWVHGGGRHKGTVICCHHGTVAWPGHLQCMLRVAAASLIHHCHLGCPSCQNKIGPSPPLCLPCTVKKVMGCESAACIRATKEAQRVNGEDRWVHILLLSSTLLTHFEALNKVLFLK